MLRVVDDVLIDATTSQWRIDFNDGSDVIVAEVTCASPPYYRQVAGDFTPERIEAIKTFSRLETRPQ